MRYPFSVKMHRRHPGVRFRFLAQLLICSGVPAAWASSASTAATGVPPPHPGVERLARDGVFAWAPPPEAVATEGPLATGALRISPRYAVRVRRADPPSPWQTATVYGSVPRNGHSPASSRPDGARYAVDAGLTMSWASVLYRSTVEIEIERLDDRPRRGPASVTLRPTPLGLDARSVAPGRWRIRVPYRLGGVRFSVEFSDDLVTAYNDGNGISGTLTPHPTPYAVHTEPRHALLLFVQPDVVTPPCPADGAIAVIEPGPLHPGQLPEADVLVFRPGLHTLPVHSHAYLPARTRWLHLQPGAYIQGAFEFRGERTDYRVTGYGVISGEQYVYEADRRRDGGRRPYTQRSEAVDDCHGTCVRLLQAWSSESPQTLLVDGVTLANPPYHTFTVFGNPETFSNRFRHYKQVGCWYWQTDGPELFPRGRLLQSFLHANDDAIKLYHSDVRVEEVVVWKGENGPVFQWGWIPRTVRRVRVRDIDIIHNRTGWLDAKHNSGIFNSAGHWNGPAHTAADPRHEIADLQFERIRAEGLQSVAMRWTVLASWRDIVIRDFWVEAWNDLPRTAQQSLFRLAPSQPGQPRVQLGPPGGDGVALQLIDYRVGEQTIDTTTRSDVASDVGRLGFDEALRSHWNARAADSDIP